MWALATFLGKKKKKPTKELSIDTVKCKSIPGQCSLSIPPKNIREPRASKVLMGYRKGTLV